MSIKTTTSAIWATVFAFGLGACGSDDGDGSPASGGAPGVVGSGGAPGGTTAAGGATAPVAGGSTATGGAATGSGGTSAGGQIGTSGGAPPGGGAGGPASGGSSGSGGAASGGTPATGGAGGSGGGGVHPDCKGESAGPCGTFVTSTGQKIPLGPAGAMMDVNVGAGFEVAIASGDRAGSTTCNGFVAGFGEDAEASKALLDISKLKMDLFTVYRPATVVPGEKYPILTWGNGTCAKPEGYGALLRYIASHGYYVFAANSRWVGGNGAMTRALDFAFAANGDSASPYHQRLDTAKVGAMGHSQGSGATVTAARDARVKAAILFNGGTSASKPFFAVSGDNDLGNPTATTYRNGMNGATKAAFIFYHNVPETGSASGHVTLMTQPERVVEPSTGFWNLVFRDDPQARALFVGTGCGLCNKTADFDFGSKGF